MRLSRQEFDRLRMMNNYVVLEIDIRDGIYKMQNGAEIIIDTSFEKIDHQTVVGTVIKVPENLRYTRKYTNLRKSMDWQTKTQIMYGDKVWVGYYALLLASGKTDGYENYVYEVGDDIYIMVPYQELIVAKRGDEIIPLNGYCLLEAVETNTVDQERFNIDDPNIDFRALMGNKVGGNKLIIPKHLSKVRSKRIAKVLHKAIPNTSYNDVMTKKDLTAGMGGDNNIDKQVSVGDYVILRKNQHKPIENKLYRQFADKDILKCQYRDMLAIIPQELVDKTVINK